MPLQKTNLDVPFMGLDLKTDPFKLAPGKFLSLENTIPIKGGPTGILLQKRNGFLNLATVATTNTFITTFNDNLTIVGTSLSAYSSATQSFTSKGNFYPIELSTLALIRTSSNQSQVDTAIASNGLICTVFTETAPSTAYKYAIADSVTGQNIVAPTTISSPAESPRVFVLGAYFIILFSQSTNLKYISIPVSNPSNPAAAATLVTNYAIGGTQLAFDGVISNNNLYVSYNATDGGGAIRMTYLNSFLARQTAATGTNIANAKSADMIGVCVDSTGVSPVIWTAFYKTAGTTGYVVAVDQSLNSILTATQIIAAGTILNITCAAKSAIVTVFYEVSTVYGYGAGLATNIINQRTCTTAGSLGTASTILRSVGLASKAFIVSSTEYMLALYSSSYQPSYFLIDSSGNIVAKLAYSNGDGYLTTGLPSVSINDTTASVGYLIKDLIQASNKAQSPLSSTPVFDQTGINLANFDFTNSAITTAEIGLNLHLSGGMVWAYDGYSLVEQGFNLWPDNVIVTTATGAGSIAANDYYYVAVYAWTDNQGNVHRSAPSLPVKQTTTTASSTNTIKVPTLRLTYKTANPVRIELYRWSTTQQTYYQVTGPLPGSTVPLTLNSTTTDNVTITDTLADASIVGNNILYTTGGVVENIGPPAAIDLELFKSRLFLIDAEDRNLVWYSKQVIEATPVEMSDLFTVFVAPTIGAQGSTGQLTALGSMDDKLIFFKRDAIYYMTGTGPDNTGAQNDFSDPIFITSTVGCSNPNSIVFQPQGLMFQSDKGIWLLGRDLSTSYIGAPVENFNDSTVLSAITVPGTNQVRFTLDSGEVLMYDYYFGQWGVFTGIPSISSTLYQNLHTFIDSYGRVFQENTGNYLDGSNPVLMQFQTGWFNLAGLQGYERAYYFYLLATYVTPHTLTLNIAYDYTSSSQQIIITPDNFNGTLGDSPILGDETPLGGHSALEQARIFFQQQKCEAFQITLQENYDNTLGVSAGAGLTLSGLDLVVGVKKGYVPIPAAHSFG